MMLYKTHSTFEVLLYIALHFVPSVSIISENNIFSDKCFWVFFQNIFQFSFESLKEMHESERDLPKFSLVGMPFSSHIFRLTTTTILRETVQLHGCFFRICFTYWVTSHINLSPLHHSNVGRFFLQRNS